MGFTKGIRTRAGALAAVAMLGASALAVPAAAGDFPGGPAYSNDLVTGYRCVDNGCTVVRLPNSNCLCTKENPTEQNLSRLRLDCKTREAGQWVACPVQPPFGN